MSRAQYRTVVKALITYKGKILIGQKEGGDKPHSNKWHFLGGHVDHGEQPEEAIEREVKEETGLEVHVHQIIDVMAFSWEKGGEPDAMQILYHCEAETDEAEPMDDLRDIKWVEPENIEKELWDEEVKRLENREERAEFIEKLKKMPVV